MIKDNEIYTYEDISEGQKLIIGIAFKLAILMRDGSFGIVIADEGLSSLDDENLPKIFDLFSGTNFQLLSVVHRFSNINDINIIDLNKL
jgi:DNA repair exonuclease SbcCD ATPase subunit